MNQLDTILNTINLINTTLPAAAGLILSFRHSDGTEMVLSKLNENDIANDINIAQAEKFIADHQG